MGARRCWASLALAAALAGCGGSSPASTVSTTTTTVPQRPAPVPAGWERRIDIVEGYSMAVPPGWRAERRGTTTLVRSPDHLVAVSIAADRTADALGVPVRAFATQTLAALPGYAGTINPSPPRPLGGTPLDAVVTDATAVRASDGIRVDLTLVVLRRPAYVNYTAVVAANAGRTPPGERAAALRMLRTLRDYPVGPRPGPSNGA